MRSFLNIFGNHTFVDKSELFEKFYLHFESFRYNSNTQKATWNIDIYDYFKGVEFMDSLELADKRRMVIDYKFQKTGIFDFDSEIKTQGKPGYCFHSFF